AVQRREVGRRRVPDIIADEHSQPAQSRVHDPQLIAWRKAPALIPRPVIQQKQLAVAVGEPAARKVERAVVKRRPTLTALLQPDDDIYLAAEGDQRLLLLCTTRFAAGVIAGQAQLG